MSYLQNSRASMGRGSLMPPKESFSFPPLKAKEITQCLHQLGITVTEEELVHPEKHADQIRRIYEYLTELCMGVSREEIQQPAFSGLHQLSFPELHEDSIPQINSFRACQKLLEVCGIHDFTIKDFMAPVPKRLIRQMSGIINFAKFREERFALLTELTTHREDVLEAYKKAKMVNEERTRKLALLKEQTAEEAVIISTIEAECKDIETTISQLNHTQAEIREEISDLKATSATLKDQVAQRSVAFEELIDTRRRLQGQIVTSPEKFRRQIQDVAEALKEEQQSVRNNERKYREIAAWVNHVDEVTGVVNQAYTTLQDVHTATTKQKAVADDVDAQKQLLARHREALQALDVNLQQLGRQSTRTEEKLSHLRKQSTSRSKESKKALDQLHEQIYQAEEARRGVTLQTERVEADISAAERELQNDVRAQKIEREDMLAAYRHLEDTVQSHMKEMRDAMEGSLGGEDVSMNMSRCV